MRLTEITLIAAITLMPCHVSAQTEDGNVRNRVTAGIGTVLIQGRSTTRISAGYRRDITVVPGYPVLLESGADLTFAQKTAKTESGKTGFRLTEIKIPVNAVNTLFFPIAEGVAYIPLRISAGLNLAAGILGQRRADYGEGEIQVSAYGKGGLRRVHTGWQVGIGTQFNRWTAGIEYSGDITRQIPGVKRNRGLEIQAGYCF